MWNVDGVAIWILNVLCFIKKKNTAFSGYAIFWPCLFRINIGLDCRCSFLCLFFFYVWLRYFCNVVSNCWCFLKAGKKKIKKLVMPGLWGCHTYLLEAHWTFVRTVKLFLTLRRLAKTYKGSERGNQWHPLCSLL